MYSSSALLTAVYIECCVLTAFRACPELGLMSYWSFCLLCTPVLVKVVAIGT